LNEGQARYYWDKGGEIIEIDPGVSELEPAVFSILAELASASPAPVKETFASA
jgi:hypothetical protein